MEDEAADWLITKMQRHRIAQSETISISGATADEADAEAAKTRTAIDMSAMEGKTPKTFDPEVLRSMPPWPTNSDGEKGSSEGDGGGGDKGDGDLYR